MNNYDEINTYFISKYAFNGTLIWEYQYDTFPNVYSTSMSLNSVGNIIICGYTVPRIPYETDHFFDDEYFLFDDVSKCFISVHSQVNGSLLWKYEFGYMSSNYTYDCITTGVTIDNDNNIYVSGYTNGDMYDTNHGGWDGFISKYNGTNGTALWGVQFGDLYNDYAVDLVLNSDHSSVYVTGHTYNGMLYSYNTTTYLCDPYEVTGPDYTTCNIEIPANQYFIVSTCPQYGGSYAGDTTLLLYDSTNTVQLTYSLNNVCSKLTYINDKSYSVAYVIRNSCYNKKKMFRKYCCANLRQLSSWLL
jgi:hypothetical protein